MRLYILGKEIEMKSEDIAQTKQANDIASVETRQTNFTTSFNIPKTAKNIRTLKDLGIIGNDSNVPYQKNEAYLYADNGECLIYKGWAVFSDDFKCNIYDGNLELFKAIENKTLSNLNLTALKHSKTLTEVLSTFNNSKPYKYILADYNGKMTYSTNIINIDYLIPSVRASWLIEAIELYSGFKLNGSFKTNPDFVNLYITYPKGTPEQTATTKIYDANNGGMVANDGIAIEAGVGFRALRNTIVNVMIKYDFVGSAYLTVNNIQYGEYSPANNSIQTVRLNEGDLLASTYYSNMTSDIPQAEWGISTIDQFNTYTIDFLEELKGMTIRDFLNEIVWMFGLTLFKNKYDNVYNLKTVSERTNQSNAIDWSHKFNGEIGEKYIFGAYAQNNYMRYKYNDQNASYNDGYFIIDNKNIDDKKTVIQSKIYSPELSLSNTLGFTSKVYKLWDKTPKDDGATTYKALANRFYFIRSIDKSFTGLSIGSESLTTTGSVALAPVESYKGLDYQSIIIKNYSEMQKLLNKSIVKNALLLLKDTDIADLDLSVPYYFKQLGGSFILNKVPNYLPNKKTSVELVRINYSNEDIKFIPSHYSKEHYSSLYYST